MKKALIALACLLLAFAVLVGGYVSYVYISYERLDDRLVLDIDKGADDYLKIGQTYTAATYNIGFGAYGPDFTFFMDGGKESRARSYESCKANVLGAAQTLKDLDADIILFQEVDIKATRSHHINQYELLRENFPHMDAVKAINYDSAYLFYPLTKPHGKSLSSLVTMSRFNIFDSLRRSLPISTDFSKFFDLDRCYSVSRLDTESGRNLYLYNVHMSAYSGDEKIRQAQVDMLFDDITERVRQGDYVICGGDFNHDLPGDSVQILNGDSKHEYTWAQSFPVKKIPGVIELCDNYEGGELVPTARNNDMPYEEGKTFVIVIDGFFVSPDVEVLKVENHDTGFLYSDHNPVTIEFRLK